MFGLKLVVPYLFALLLALPQGGKQIIKTGPDLGLPFSPAIRQRLSGARYGGDGIGQCRWLG
jgi:hypothetical protein